MLKQERKYGWIILALLWSPPGHLYSQDISGSVTSVPGFNLHTDFLYQEDGRFSQDVYYTAPTIYAKAEIKITSYQYSSDAADSMLIYSLTSTGQELKKGTGTLKLAFQSPSRSYILPSYREAILRTDLIPPGNYKVFVEVQLPEGHYTRTFLRETDSTLAPHAGVRKGIAQLLMPAHAESAKDKAGILQVLERSGPRMEQYFRKKGLRSRRSETEGKEMIDLYYNEWFMGRYEVYTHVPLSRQLQDQQRGMGNNIGALTRNGLGDYTSLMSQFKEVKKEGKENKEITGTIALGANFSNDQEPGSGQDNTFYEARGAIEFPLLGIPVSLSGYYTTQDRNREAKASYVHFRYDANKAKEQLMDLVGSFNTRYQQVLAQGVNYEMVYGQFIQQLQRQKDIAVAELKQESGLRNFDPATFRPEELQKKALERLEQEKDKLADSLETEATSGSAATKVKEKQQQLQELKQQTEDQYQRALKKYEEIRALEQKINRYRGLLEQYKNTSHYDSLLAYSKIKELGDVEQMSYKDMARKASALLPEGKVKGAFTGLTSFDAGMFPKYVSGYTLSGQVLKGADLGYDIGFANAGITYGRTEYIDREGNVESYKSYGLRTQFKPVLQQSVGLVYFGYSPSRKLLEDNNFFKGETVSLPSFRNPVHIASLTYGGRLSSFFELSGEYATSFKSGQSEEARQSGRFTDRSAYNIQLTGTIPSTSITFTTGYERAGKAFENNTMLMLLAGTERLLLKGKGDFFRSFLSLGVEYNYMLQHNLHSKGSNSRWGFDIATHSRRLPSLYLSYKPFSTFRSFDDTLQIEQKPMVGEVWTGRLNYQIKKLDRALRFNLLYNYNNSMMDTITYSSSLLQLSAIYTKGQVMMNVSGGINRLATSITTAYPAYNSSTFLQLSAGVPLLKALHITGGGDIARSEIGWSRYSVFTGTVYSFARIPVMIRANFRYSNFRMNEVSGWKELYSGGLELAWRFKVKINDR